MPKPRKGTPDQRTRRSVRIIVKHARSAYRHGGALNPGLIAGSLAKAIRERHIKPADVFEHLGEISSHIKEITPNDLSRIRCQLLYNLGMTEMGGQMKPQYFAEFLEGAIRKGWTRKEWVVQRLPRVLKLHNVPEETIKGIIGRIKAFKG